MMIMLSPEDFRKLSPSCQREVLALLTGGGMESFLGDDEMSLPYESVDKFSGLADDIVYQGSELEWASSAPSLDVPETGAKKVIDISPDQARELIANVSEKSQEALRLFASGQPVLLETLVGSNAPYRDLNDLKRSLVGAVNRRLRTVTENRSAVLFSSDRDKTRIRITQISATSLRHALNVQEPIPAIQYFDKHGKSIPLENEEAAGLHLEIMEAWNDLTERPSAGKTEIHPAQILSHFMKHGFSMTIGRLVVSDDHGEELRYEFMSKSPGMEDVISALDQDGRLKLQSDRGIVYTRAFVVHSSMPYTYAAITAN